MSIINTKNLIEFDYSYYRYTNFVNKVNSYVKQLKNISRFEYGEILAMYSLNSHYGFKQNTDLGSGEMYLIDDTSYSYYSGDVKRHSHPISFSFNFDVYNYNSVVKGDSKGIDSGPTSGVKCNSDTKAGTKGSTPNKTIYRTPYNSGNDINKVYFPDACDFYEYVGGSFFQDPYTLEYSGEPDEYYFLQIGITKEQFYDNIQDEIIKFSENKDSLNKEIRQEIAQCYENIKEGTYKKDETKLKYNINRMKEYQTLNKYYMIENSVRGRNEMNFTPNKEFAPKVSYSDNGAYQLDPSNLSVYQSSDYGSD